MDCVNLSQKDSFIFSKAVHFNSTISCNNHKITIIIGKSELFQEVICMNLMLDEKRISIINVYIVTILTHNCKF